MTELQQIIEKAWDNRDLLKEEATTTAIRTVVDLLDKGELRVAEPITGGWQVNEWVKKAVVLYFPIQKMETLEAGIFEYHDKIPLKKNFAERGIRVVPNAVARHGAYISAGTILMPSYVNIGAYVDEGTMVDTWATVGSCAQIGKNVHLSGGVGIGGVLEPLQAAPVIIEDNAFIGAGAVIVEGIQVLKGAVIAPGVILSKGVPIYDCVNERMLDKGEPIPENAIVVPGTRPVNKKLSWASEMGLNMNCALIVKFRDEKSDASLELEQFLR